VTMIFLFFGALEQWVFFCDELGARLREKRNRISAASMRREDLDEPRRREDAKGDGPEDTL
jgi:hypothetical protein